MSKGRYVVVDPDELEPFMPAATRTVDLEEFVDLSEIDPVYFDASYYVAPDANPKPYALLARAMEEAGKVAIGRFVMRNKQYTAAIRAQDGRLVMSTLAYADEIVPADSIDELADVDEIEVSPREVQMAEALVESLTGAVRAGEVPRRLPRAGPRPDRAEGRRRGVRGARADDREAEDRRPDGGARGQRGGGQDVARPPPDGEEVGGEGEEVGVADAAPRSRCAKRNEVVTEVDGRHVALSNLDKVLYPSGSPRVRSSSTWPGSRRPPCPHLRGRALTFRRFPNGTDKQGFFEKRCPAHRPEWVSVALGPGDRQGGIEYCCIEEPAAMVWAANMAALELHAPMALAADLDTPRAVVFDFDPGPNTDISDCCAIAAARPRRPRRRRARGVVQDVGLQGPAALRAAQHRPASPTSGRPQFALAVGQVLEKQLPKQVTTVMAKVAAAGEDLRRLEPERPPQDDDRPVLAAGPARADGVHAGVVGRGRGGVRTGDVELRFEAADVLARIDEHGDLFAPVLTVEQQLPG